jgi:hypothetical protein
LLTPLERRVGSTGLRDSSSDLFIVEGHPMMTINNEQTRGFNLAQVEDEMFIAAKGGARLQRSRG